MINVTRSSLAPDSLNDPKIQKYLDQLDAYKQDQQLPSAQQTLVKPECSKSYRNADLFDLFEADFFSKCYLTEKLFVTPWSMDVEHFWPRNEKPELTYAWSNLYPADHDANMHKPNQTPVGGYLDPCNPGEDVEKSIRYAIDIEGGAVHFEATDLTNQKAVNTAQLLQRVHNGHSYDTRKKAAEIQTAIQRKYIIVLEHINAWWKAVHEQNQVEEFESRRKLMRHLSRRSAYTMLMRSTKAVRALPDSFLD